MIVRLLGPAIAIALLGASFAEDAPPKESKELSGAWLVASAQEAGQDRPQAKGLRFVVQGAQFTAGAWMQGTFTVDTAKTPKTIDFKVASGLLHAGKTLEGIYELNGDTIRICYAEGTGKRPQQFSSTRDNGAFLLVCNRAKTDWLVQWLYDDKARKEAKDNPNLAVKRIFRVTTTTTDDVEKVSKFYQGVLDANNRLEYAFRDKQGKFQTEGRAAAKFVVGPDSQFGQSELSVDERLSELLGIPINPNDHVYTLGQDDSLSPSNDQKQAPRPVTVRVFTQDTEESTVNIVITRARDEKHTHIVATFIRR